MMPEEEREALLRTIEIQDWTTQQILSALPDDLFRRVVAVIREVDENTRETE